ncbi:unnamed protein product [Closterium sp. Naga37s-1]|nr:unnamed protein product [Closterium sp. Naga37s-1]
MCSLIYSSFLHCPLPHQLIPQTICFISNLKALAKYTMYNPYYSSPPTSRPFFPSLPLPQTICFISVLADFKGPCQTICFISILTDFKALAKCNLRQLCLPQEEPKPGAANASGKAKPAAAGEEKPDAGDASDSDDEGGGNAAGDTTQA